MLLRMECAKLVRSSIVKINTIVNEAMSFELLSGTVRGIGVPEGGRILEISKTTATRNERTRHGAPNTESEHT